MIVSLDPDSVLPPYEQLRRQIAAMVTLGSLRPGTRLPSIRQLAADLDVAPGTIARTYRELKRDGFVDQRGRHGTTVTRPPTTDPSQERHARLAQAARDFAAVAGEIGHDVDDAIVQVRVAFDELSSAR